MASFSPSTSCRTFFQALSGTSSTDVYTVGDQGESGAWLIGVVVVDSTGSVAVGAKVGIYRGSTEYWMTPHASSKPSDSENLEVICEPALELKRGDEVRAKGATGHHVWVTLAFKGLDTSTQAQTKATA